MAIWAHIPACRGTLRSRPVSASRLAAVLQCVRVYQNYHYQCGSRGCIKIVKDAGKGAAKLLFFPF